MYYTFDKFAIKNIDIWKKSTIYIFDGYHLNILTISEKYVDVGRKSERDVSVSHILNKFYPKIDLLEVKGPTGKHHKAC